MSRTISAPDWTGSSQQRREQGVCLPPSTAPNDQPRYLIPAGTAILVRPVAGFHRWKSHNTNQPLEFRKYEQKRLGMYSFRQDGWLIRIAVARTTDRTKREEAKRSR